MALSFKVLELRARVDKPRPNLVQLIPGDWDDYAFKTSFQAIYFDTQGQRIELGSLKIGYIGQSHGWTRDAIPKTFDKLPDGWFSLGQDVDYYTTAYEKLTTEDRADLLGALRDVVSDEQLLNRVQSEKVFSTSLMRSVSLSVILGQFRRVIAGEVVLTDFHFSYRDPGDERNAPIDLDFRVKANSNPSTNIHVLIGRNGVGKTTLLNNMVVSTVNISAENETRGRFCNPDSWNGLAPLPQDYFSSVVSVSFSAFDPFIPPVDQPDRTRGLAYFYVGMKKARIGLPDSKDQPPKTDADLHKDFLESFESCLSQATKRSRWGAAIRRLESDPNFEDMALGRLLDMDEGQALKYATSLVRRMSSGHAIVLLTMTKLVDTVEEKTLVLMDEPESHLHPPLLSAFIRALSDLLHSRNGVAIIATHSPVVVQEVPKSCVWKLTRIRTAGRSDRPERETFGENVGVLTREIFGLEVSKSGFHDMLRAAVNSGGTFETILERYKGQLGIEAQAVLRALVAARDSKLIGGK